MTTQKDIAAALGVSVSLVSRALAGKAQAIGVPPDTISRIRDAAKTMGYVPDAAARVLRGARTMVIGAVVFDFEDPFFGPVVGGLQRLARKAGFAVMLTGPDVAPLARYRLDGLIVLGSGDWDDGGDLPARDPIPTIRIGSGSSPDAWGQICTDDTAGMSALVDHLLHRGRRRFGFLGALTPAHRDRFTIFRRLCEERGLETRPDWWAFSPEPITRAGQDAAGILVSQTGDESPDAVLASSDTVAVGAYSSLAAAGLTPGSRLAVTGYDGLPMGELVNPALTTVRQPVEDMINAAFAWLRTAMDANPTPIRRRFPPTLLIRDSTTARIGP